MISHLFTRALRFVVTSCLIWLSAASASMARQVLPDDHCDALAVLLAMDVIDPPLTWVARDALARELEQNAALLGLMPETVTNLTLHLRFIGPRAPPLSQSERDALHAQAQRCYELAQVLGRQNATGRRDSALMSPEQRKGIGRLQASVQRVENAPDIAVNWGMLAAIMIPFGAIIPGLRRYALWRQRSRRRAKRFACSIAAHYRIGDAPAMGAYVEDISRIGCRLRLLEGELEPDAQINLALKSLQINARVVWKNTHFVGAEFASPLTRAEIDQLIGAPLSRLANRASALANRRSAPPLHG